MFQDAKDTDIKEYFGKCFLICLACVQFSNGLFAEGQYGEIEHINLKHDPMTGRSRGFAFIVFKVKASFSVQLAVLRKI